MQPGDELSVQRVPLTLPWYAVPAASLVVALPAALPEGDEPTPLFAPRAAVAPAVTWRAPPTPSAPPVPWQQEAEESWPALLVHQIEGPAACTLASN